MNITLKPETQRLLELRMREGDYSSPDDVIRIALESLEGETFEELDPRTQAAIARAEAQAERGEGIPIDDAFEILRRKHCGS
jgi:Arc/MetJ-type ribon-helix-helix transcriptional regulator